MRNKIILLLIILLLPFAFAACSETAFTTSVAQESIDGTVTLDDVFEVDTEETTDRPTAVAPTTVVPITVVPTTEEPITEESVQQPIKAAPVYNDAEETPQSGGGTYVLNTNTKKFHVPDCESVGKMKEKNKSEFSGSRDEVIAMGYSPCKRCNP